MPGIELQRLNGEIKQLTNQFGQVEHFYSGLVILMEKYANWSFRAGDVTRRNIQIPQYHTSPLILQKLILAVKMKCRANVPKSMELIGLLRQGRYLELRSTAIHILAVLPFTEPEIRMQYISEWALAEKEAVLQDELFSTGCAPLRANAPLVWLKQIEKWLDTNETRPRIAALRALLVSVNDLSFQHLPNIYKLTTEMLITVPQGLTALLQDLLEALIHRSPAETSFLLRQILLRSPSPDTARLIRKKFNILPLEYQPILRSLLFDLGKTTGPDESSGSGKDLV